MSKKNKKSNQKVIDEKQKTSTGLWCVGGELTTNDLDTVSWQELRKDYDNMMKDTPALASSFNLLCYPIEAAKFRIDVGKSKSELSKEASEYINYCWENLEGGFNYFLRHVLLALTNGLALFEKIIKNGDEYKYLINEKYKNKLTNRIVYYSPIQNETISKFYYNESGKFSGIYHEKRIPEGFSDFIDIKEGSEGIKSIDDILTRYTWKELFNDVRGNSILRPARLSWTCCKKIIIGHTIAIQSGHGLVEVITPSKPSSSDITQLKNMAKGINILNGDNFFIHEEAIKINLHEPKSQNDVMQTVDYHYKQILLTLLTQFISIGMGQVGAFNAGETQKSPYELALNNLTEDLKRFFQKETEYMIGISYLSGLSKEDMPIFEFNSIAQSDLLKTSQILLNLRNTGINFSVEELNTIKGLLGFLPEKQIEVTDQTTIQQEDESKKNVEMKAGKVRNIKPALLEFESKVFDSNKVEEHYLSIEEKADSTIKDIMMKIFNDVKGQIKAGRKVDIRYGKELESKLTKLFDESYSKGESDVKLEIKKTQEFKQLKLKSPSIELISKKVQDKQNKIISLSIDKLLKDIENKINYDITSMSEKQLSNLGGAERYIESLTTSFDKDKRNLINDITSGYTTGRNETLDLMTEDDTEFFYSGILDKNLCNKCSEWDGLTFTKKEILESNQFSLSGNSINLSCLGLLGQNKCRCAWILYS